jgi:hypothetical protein
MLYALFKIRPKIGLSSLQKWLNITKEGML